MKTTHRGQQQALNLLLDEASHKNHVLNEVKQGNSQRNEPVALPNVGNGCRLKSSTNLVMKVIKSKQGRLVATTAKE